MPIEPGQTVLHYRLIEKIGEAGWARSGRPRDTTLDREVAIKALPDAFAQDEGRLAQTCLPREAWDVVPG